MIKAPLDDFVLSQSEIAILRDIEGDGKPGATSPANLGHNKFVVFALPGRK
jgi:hypothetical protein